MANKKGRKKTTIPMKITYREVGTPEEKEVAIKNAFYALFDAVLEREKEEKVQIEKIKQAKTGEPIELTGYAVFDQEGNDTGKRFARREDAEAYQREMYGE